MVNLIFDGTSGLKLEMTSYADNTYDVTNPSCCFETFVLYTLFLSSFIVVRHQMAELNPVHYTGVPDPVQNRADEYIIKSRKAVAIPAIFYSHWQLDILKAVL